MVQSYKIFTHVVKSLQVGIDSVVISFVTFYSCVNNDNNKNRLGLHGIDKAGGAALSECMVFGRRVGKEIIAKYQNQASNLHF